MNPNSGLPSVLRLAWMLFMQPILLHRELTALGIKPDAKGWALWQAGGIHRQYLIRLMATGFVVLMFGHLLLVAIRIAVGAPINWTSVAIGVAVGMAGVVAGVVADGLIVGLVFGVAVGLIVALVFGVAVGVADDIKTNGLAKSLAQGLFFVLISGVASGVASGMVFSVAGGMAGGVAFGVAIGVAIGLAGGVVDGLVIGLLVGVAFGVARSVAVSVADGVAGGVVGGVAGGLAFGVAGGLAFGMAIGVATATSFILMRFRIPLYIFDYLLSVTAWLRQRQISDSSLSQHSVFFHDLCYLPLPFLEKHILHVATSHPDDVVNALNACVRSPGQHGIYRRATARLAAQTLELSARSDQFERVMMLRGEWLPSAESASQGILAFRDIAKYIEASRYATAAHQRQKYLNDAQLELDRLPLVLAEESKERRAALTPIQPIWQETLNELRAKADAEAANSVPNPFLTQSLSTASGVEVFVGRDDIIRTLDAILADPQQRNSLALLGPRRCGKSSLLRMLPLKLPDAVPVFFDLQDNPATTPAQFFSAIASRAAEQARRERDLVLPKLAPNPDITTFAQWLEQVDAALGSRRLLLCIDEFERLPDLFPGDHRSLLQLMGLFRATVQNRRNIRLLVAGVAPFDELDAIWSDHLINLRELRVEHLDPDSALRLLTRPIPGFDAIPEPVAREVIARTGCQPLLLQLYGSMLVDRLNAEQRIEATIDDLTAVDRAVREEGNAVNHFRNIYDSAPDDARAVLLALSDASAPSPKMSSGTRRYLLRRCFITPEGVPRIPVFFDWVHAEHG